MAEIHHDATVTPSKQELIQAWIGDQRWYAAKGATPQIRRLRGYRFDDPRGEVGIETLIVADDSGTSPVIYQVPLTYRASPLEGAEPALVGTLEHSVLGTRYVYDGCHDPAYGERLLAVMLSGEPVASSRASGTVDTTVTGAAHPKWTTALTYRSSQVLRGEQSNTSIIIEAVDSEGTSTPIMAKVFRILAPGRNPDVELQGALFFAGCDRVPASVGSISASWPAPEGLDGDDGEPAAYDLVFAQEFLPGVRDAWRVASDAVLRGEDFAASAQALGAATAQVHAALATSVGTAPTTPHTRAAIIDGMRERYAAATAHVPQLTRYAPVVERLLKQALDADWPAMQRIHGDYHLGQVLHSSERGWILLDFEGEPMRPLAERTEPDQWIRDVAGMLRSFDYAGGSYEQENSTSARAWVASASAAFLTGYAGEAGEHPSDHAALLAVFELDKAMYELVYEARNRPSWVGIPLAAIDRLTAAHGVTESADTTPHRTTERTPDFEEHA